MTVGSKMRRLRQVAADLRDRRTPNDHPPNLFISVSDQHRLIHILEDRRALVADAVTKRRLTKLIDKLYAVKWT